MADEGSFGREPKATERLAHQLAEQAARAITAEARKRLPEASPQTEAGLRLRRHERILEANGEYQRYSARRVLADRPNLSRGQVNRRRHAALRKAKRS